MKQTNIKTTHNNNNIKNNNTVKKICNWSEYNNSLEKRGSILLCIDQDLAFGKYNKPLHNHMVGRPREYADSLIELVVSIRALYHLPLRQTIGFMKYWFRIMDIQLSLPDYTTVSRRIGKLDIKLVQSLVYKYKDDGIILCIDSSGFKIYGEGEWKVRKHGKSKRRTWLETHIAVDYKTRDILGIINTDNNTHDNTQVLPLLITTEKNLKKVGSNRPLSCIIGDGAYFAHNTFNLAKQLNTELIAPPHKNTKLHMNMKKHQLYDTPGWEAYNKTMRETLHYGLEDWKKLKGYHRRSLVENAFYRMKVIFNDKSNYRTNSNQMTEQLIRAKIINQFNELGLPKYQTA